MNGFMVSGDSISSLPSDIQGYEKQLLNSLSDIEKVIQLSDGLLEPVGLDAIVGVIPIAGGLYTTFASGWLFVLANQIKAPLQEIFILCFLSAVDLIVGFFPVVGDFIDAGIRTHAWCGERLIKCIKRQLLLIENARFEMSQNRDIDFVALRNQLFTRN